MSNADPAEMSVIVERDGVTIEKSFEPNDFPVPAIAFVIRSDREESVQVRLSDRVPEEVDAEDIGFHPKYGAEFWHVEEGGIVFERDFEPGEEYTTVYGLRASETDEVESYLSEPELEAVDPPLDDSGRVVRDVIGDANDDVEELDLSDPDESDVETDAGTAQEPPSDDDIEAALAAAEGETSGEDATGVGSGDEAGESIETDNPDTDGDTDATEEADSGAASGTGTEVESATHALDRDVVGALAAEIRSGNVADDDLRTLREALDVGDGDDDGGTKSSVDARIERLQTETSDLRAYTDALEEFLDENGDAQQLLREVRGSIDDIEEELATVEERTEDNAQRVGEVDADLAAVDEEVDGLSDAVSNVEERVDDLADEVDDIDDRLDHVDELDDRVGSVESDLADARDDIEALSEMREQLTSVFGAQMNDDTDDE